MAYKNKHILFVIGNLNVGGTEQQLAMLAAQLVARKWQVSLFSLELTGPLVNILRSKGVRLHDGGYRSFNGSYLRKLLSLAMAQFRLFMLILKTRPAIVHAFLPLANFMGAVAGRSALIPMVITSKRALSTHQDRHPQLRWLDHVANRLSHKVTANSNVVAEDVAYRDGYRLEKIKIIANGLDFSKFQVSDIRRDEMRKVLELQQNEIAIGFVANLIPYKGHAELIDAIGYIGKAHPQAKLFLIGEDRGIGVDLNKQIHDRGLQDKVVLLGSRTDIPDLLAAMDIGVMASHEEGFSNALLEKLAIGLPIVATDVGGNAEALEGMANCQLVEPSNAKSIARGLDKMIIDLEAATEAKTERRARIQERFSISAMVDAYEKLYTEDR